ncbi:hypothetical protein B0T19DRAFT_63295 [Cercophora scortea]|uniref:Uncharacterized protein n=1 Tax=Cercophora scortea TaxID=314031 RepID=A0AAE0J604_9PEZI|nr:hypothetical protein B0T19DRAFT_63295 [Cercophora scortea]
MDSTRDRLYHAAKIVSSGTMITTAVLFPLASTEGLWFRALTLSIFVIASLAFHGLHVERFKRFGLYVAPVALLFLLLVVIAAGHSRTELIPWLPLFTVFSSLATVAIDTGYANLSTRQQDIVFEFSGVSVDPGREESSSGSSGGYTRQPPSESYRQNPLFFGRYGPSSQTSRRTESGESELTLSGVQAQPRAHWDSQTRSHFAMECGQPALGSPGPIQTWTHEDLGLGRGSFSEHTGSDRPLLEHQ